MKKVSFLNLLINKILPFFFLLKLNVTLNSENDFPLLFFSRFDGKR